MSEWNNSLERTWDWLEKSTDTMIQHLVNSLSKELSSNMKALDLYDIEKIKELISIEINNAEPLTRWTEWEIYKIVIKVENCEYEFLIAKKLHSATSHIEYDNHKHIYDFLKLRYENLNNESGNLVNIPRPFFVFDEWNKEVIVMEYVHWKTLYTLMWEAIINQFLLRHLNSLPNDAYIQSFLKEIFDNHAEEKVYKWWNYIFEQEEYDIRFENDTDAEDTVKQLLDLLSNYTRFDLNMEEVFKKYMYEISIFSDKEKDNLSNIIKEFLGQMHNHWFYHRDLWWNPRNIMLWDDWRPYIIDFWKSAIVRWTSSENVYEDINWVYDKDENIISAYIDKLWSREIKEDYNWNNFLNEWLPLEFICVLLWIDSQEFVSYSKKLDKSYNNLNQWYFYKQIRNFIKEQLEWKDKIFPNTKINKSLKHNTEWRYYMLYLLSKLPKEKIEELKDDIDKSIWEGDIKVKRKFIYDIFNELINSL